MDARFLKVALLAAAVASTGASFRTQNFVISAPTAGMAEQIGHAAEHFRKDLAIEWLGREMPPWAEVCPINAHVSDRLGAGGATSFLFERGEVYGWQMNIQGSLERILDSVLPHEVTHTIFATHFRRPLPRWADEGACTTVEHSSERTKQQHMLISFLKTERGIPFNRMFAMKEYPRDVMPLYSQGYSVARFLIAQRGRREFIDYLGDGMREENWTRATKQHYGYDTLGHLQYAWLQWVREGSPPLQSQPEATPGDNVAQVSAPAKVRGARPEPNVIYRGQSADDGGASVYTVSARPDRAGSSRADASVVDRTRAAAPSAGPRWQPRRQPTEPLGAMIPPDDQRQPMALGSDADDELPLRPVPAAERPKSREVLLEWTRPAGENPAPSAAAPK